MKDLELKEFSVEWVANGPTLTSFRIKVISPEGKPYIFSANELKGLVSIEEEIEK